jgi:hypothetical protein
MKTANPAGVWQDIPVRPYSLIGNVVEKTDGTRVAITPLPQATLVAFPQSDMKPYPLRIDFGLGFNPFSFGCDL